MKKFIILLVSAFSFCLFSVLLVFAFATNDYGINIDESGLFPKFDFTFFDNETDQTFDNRMWTDLTAETKHFKIHNNTKDSIAISTSIDYYPDSDGNFDININSFGPVSITKQGTTFEINTLPYNEFDYTYIDYDVYSNNDSTYINVFGNEYVDNENYDPNYKTMSVEDIIKAGETYEIKLP